LRSRKRNDSVISRDCRLMLRSGWLILWLDHFKLISGEFDAIPTALPHFVDHQVKTSPANANGAAILSDLPGNVPAPRLELHRVTDMNNSCAHVLPLS
jgi:hypothetical protein